MNHSTTALGVGLLLVLALPAHAKIVKGVMGVKGAEMSWWGGMAADAISRQYDVDKNRMTLVCEPGSGNYRPGTITFFPKPGKSIDLSKMAESLRATRLSGGTNMSVEYLDITAVGDVIVSDEAVQLKLSAAPQPFVLRHAKGDKTDALGRLREAVAAGDKILSVTGRVDGWSGRFPAVLGALAKRSPEEPVVLFVTDFETNKK